MTNVQILVLFVLLLAMSLVSCVGAILWNVEGTWYFGTKGKCLGVVRSYHLGSCNASKMTLNTCFHVFI